MVVRSTYTLGAAGNVGREEKGHAPHAVVMMISLSEAGPHLQLEAASCLHWEFPQRLQLRSLETDVSAHSLDAEWRTPQRGRKRLVVSPPARPMARPAMPQQYHCIRKKIRWHAFWGVCLIDQEIHCSCDQPHRNNTPLLAC